MAHSPTCTSAYQTLRMALYRKAVTAKPVATIPEAFGQTLKTLHGFKVSEPVRKETNGLRHHFFHPERPKLSLGRSILPASLITNLSKTAVTERELTGTFGRRPSRKLLIVPNSPSCQMGKASVRTFVRFRSSSCAAAASIWAHTASLSFCIKNQSLLSEPPQAESEPAFKASTSIACKSFEYLAHWCYSGAPELCSEINLHSSHFAREDFQVLVGLERKAGRNRLFESSSRGLVDLHGNRFPHFAKLNYRVCFGQNMDASTPSGSSSESRRADKSRVWVGQRLVRQPFGELWSAVLIAHHESLCRLPLNPLIEWLVQGKKCLRG